jgi:hypothetical protein
MARRGFGGDSEGPTKVALKSAEQEDITIEVRTAIESV